MPESASWEAQLSLRFERDGARTALAGRSHHGPLRVQRPFYPEGSGACHVYVLHPPGGVVGGDRLNVEVDVATGAHALLTTPAATKLYRSAGPRASVRQTLRATGDARLEWLPQETIAFSGALADVHTRVELTGPARFIGWETLCLGRPAAGELFERGELGQRIELLRDGKLVYSERGRYAGNSPLLRAAWGLREQPVLATFLCAGQDLSPQLDALREALQPAASGPESQAALSCMGELLVARYLGPSTERARNCFTRLWEAVRPLVFGCAASAPRIWLS